MPDITVHMFIGPRQSGKTTTCMDLFERNSPDAMLIVRDNYCKKYVEKQLHPKFASGRINPHDIKSVGAFDTERGPTGVTPAKKIIIDDYLYFRKKYQNNIYQWILNNAKTDVHVITLTTSKYMFKTELLKAARTLKNRGVTPTKFHRKELEEVYYNFLTHPKAKIRHMYKPISMPSKSAFNNLSKQTLLTEYCGFYEYEES